MGDSQARWLDGERPSIAGISSRLANGFSITEASHCCLHHKPVMLAPWLLRADAKAFEDSVILHDALVHGRYF